MQRLTENRRQFGNRTGARPARVVSRWSRVGMGSAGKASFVQPALRPAFSKAKQNSQVPSHRQTTITPSRCTHTHTWTGTLTDARTHACTHHSFRVSSAAALLIDRSRKGAQLRFGASLCTLRRAPILSSAHKIHSSADPPVSTGPSADFRCLVGFGPHRPCRR
jgi:hypothetical protein